MKYTEQFIEVSITIIDTKLEDLGVNDKGLSVPLKVRPQEIEAYRSGFKDDFEGGGECVSIYMKSGESFRLNMTIEELEKKLNATYSSLRHK